MTDSIKNTPWCINHISPRLLLWSHFNCIVNLHKIWHSALFRSANCSICSLKCCVSIHIKPSFFRPQQALWLWFLNTKLETKKSIAENCAFSLTAHVVSLQKSSDSWVTSPQEDRSQSELMCSLDSILCLLSEEKQRSHTAALERSIIINNVNWLYKFSLWSETSLTVLCYLIKSIVWRL